MSLHKSVVQSYALLNQQLYAISTFENSVDHYTAIAVACKSKLYILKLRPNGINVSADVNNSKGPAITTPVIIIQLAADVITDVCWSPNAVNDGKIALSYSNGSVCVYSVNIDAGGSTFNKTNYKKEWESSSIDFSRSVNKVNWQKTFSVYSPTNTSYNYRLLCGCQDGSIKLFDLKNCLSSNGSANANGTDESNPPKTFNQQLQPPAPPITPPPAPDIVSYAMAGAEGCRDIRFSPLYAHLFASVYENGILAIWNCDASNSASGSVVAKPVCKVAAHLKSIMSVDWHPTVENMLATGGKESDISGGVFKVWSIKGLSASPTAATEHPILVQLYQVLCNSPVNKLMWRPSNKPRSSSSSGNVLDSDDSSITYHICTSNSSSMGATSSISMWDITKGHVPIIVLQNPCQDSNKTSGSSTVPGDSSDNANNSRSIILGFEWLDTPYDHTTMSNSTDSLDSTSKNKPNVMRSRPSNLSASVPSTVVSVSGYKQSRKLMNVNQHVIAFTKDGNILVYDLRNGYFPRQHLSPIAAAMSTQGVVAVHSSYIAKTSLFSLVSNDDTRRAPGFYSDRPAHFGMKLDMTNLVYDSGHRRHGAGSSNASSVFTKRGHLDSSADNTSSHRNGFGSAANTAPNDPSAVHDESKAQPTYVANWLVSLSMRQTLSVTKKPTQPSSNSLLLNGGVLSATDDDVFGKHRSRFIRSGFHYGVNRSNQCRNAQQLEYSADRVISAASVVSASATPILAKSDPLSPKLLNDLRNNDGVHTIVEHDPSVSGDPFDSTTITVFAKYYHIGDHSNSSAYELHNVSLSLTDNQETIQSVENAAQMCQWNYKVALSMNCNCRGKIWSSLAVMLPTLGSAKVSSVGIKSASSCSISSDGRSPNTTLIPYMISTIRNLLEELLDIGDVVHVVSIWELLKFANLAQLVLPSCETTGPVNSTVSTGEGTVSATESVSAQQSQLSRTDLSNTLSESRLKEAYVAYVALLQKLLLYAEANVIIKHSKDKCFGDISRSGTVYDSACGTCLKEIVEVASDKPRLLGAYCTKCKATSSKCTVCQGLVNGVMYLCPVCSHGGHYECYQQWFATGQIVCPVGCGHQCFAHGFNGK